MGTGFLNCNNYVDLFYDYIKTRYELIKKYFKQH